MELEKIKELLSNRKKQHDKFIDKSNTARRYFRCKNKIMNKQRGFDKTKPMQKSNHRIPSNFYRMLLIQKAIYLVGVTPIFSVGHEQTDEAIRNILGSKFKKTCKELVINAGNDSEAWLQYWVTADNEFKYGVVDSQDIYAIWGGNLHRDLRAVLKVTHNYLDEEGEEWDYYEYWDDQYVYSFRKESDDTEENLEEYYNHKHYNPDTNFWEVSYMAAHNYGEVPFIRFRNNNDGTNDLIGIKAAIDSYDESISSLADAIADAEEAVMILSGYGDQDPLEFWENLARDRLIKLIKDPLDAESPSQGTVDDVKYLAIEPPIEATKYNLEIMRKAIYEYGMGVDPNPENYFGNTSGEALKYMYSLLDLKAGATRDEFELGFSRLVKAICRFLGFALQPQDVIDQTWTMTKINNETEIINNAKNSLDLISKETILKHHPWVENYNEEMELIEQERQTEDNKAMDEAITAYISAMNQQQVQQNAIDSYEQTTEN